MKKSKLNSLCEAGFWLIFGVIGFAVTLEFNGPLDNFKLGAAFWPQVALGGVIFIAVIHAVTIYFFNADASEVDAGVRVPEKSSEADGTNVNNRTIAIFVVPLIYVFAMHKLGFFLVTPIFLPVYMYLMGVRKISTLFVTSVSLYGAIIFLFVVLVYTPLPQGAGYFHSLNGQFIGLFQ